jgi:SAM-dependent methyltransferase
MPHVKTRETASDLAAANLFYRQPALYDQIQADPNHTVARQIEAVIAQHAPGARTLLDLGCGTGRDLEYLARPFECVGVDLQQHLVDYASAVRPQLDIRLGDMRDFCLDRPVDVITCLGNSLAYVHDDQDLAAVFSTFAAHARPGTLLIISTLTEPAVTEPRTHRIDTADLHADVTIFYGWDPATQISTMRRVWRVDDGTTHEDRIPRRVLSGDDLTQRAGQLGFRQIATAVSGGDLHISVKHGH